ncbi:Na+/H+ antiporter subunit E [Microbulbifer sp. VAAF005]|uniref:Na+/H+ antiporter subunit E n=1 Tax=Microbulbifer sp. VAAF005 TaxID=3034230 RepID=UPI0024AD50EE|nr:Na+/H+ antiporter subunit E [Microbulbifer sp. VAAF005]WHI45571.1 Na+/H+ antiporter subunit E [Microbulbifer sp. VAAF005]
MVCADGKCFHGELFLWLFDRFFGTSSISHTAWGTNLLYPPAALGSFIFFFLEELVLSSLRAAYEVFSPRLQSRPLVVRLPMERLDRNQIFILTNLISLTPGTMVLDVTPNNDALIVHTMFVSDPDTFREEIREGFEKRVKEAVS